MAENISCCKYFSRIWINMEMIKGVTQAVAGFINIYPWLKVIQEDFFFEFKDKKWVQWCNKYLHENSWFLQCASLVLAKRIKRINKDMKLILYSPGIWVIHIRRTYSQYDRNAKQTNDNLWKHIRSAGRPHWLQPRSTYVAPKSDMHCMEVMV